MRQNRQRWCVTVSSVLVLFFSSGLSQAQDDDSVLRGMLVLPELIQEVMARNPELVAAHKQWEAATSRIAQVRSLDDPILSLQLCRGGRQPRAQRMPGIVGRIHAGGERKGLNELRDGVGV